MKKLLLLFAVAIAAAGSMWAEEEIFTYDYNNWPSWDPDYAQALTANGGNPTWTDITDDNWSADTGIVIVSANANGPTAVQTATTLINFGGTVGKVWCLNGANSGLQTYLNNNYNTNFGTSVTVKDDEGNTIKDYTGENDSVYVVPNIPAATHSGWFTLYWALPPSFTTSTDGSSNWIRTRVYINVFKSESSTDSIITNASGMYLANSNGVASPSSTPMYANIAGSMFYTDGAWDPTKYMIYEFDANFSDGSYMKALKLAFQNNNTPSLDTYAIFIKKIEFVLCSSDGGDAISSTPTVYFEEGPSYEYFTVSMTNDIGTGITSVAADAAEPVYTVNGQNVTFEAGAQIYSITGALVDVAQPGETMTLAKGFYVARVGNKGVKFAVK